ncbi:MAG: hypothetical protein AAGA56_01640 [Myxococcota bacterium]
MNDPPSKPSEPRPSQRPAALAVRRRAQRVGLALHLTVALGIALVASVQITQQIFAPAEVAPAEPFGSCEAGLERLYAAIQAGRKAALQVSDVDDPEAPLLRFRAVAGPEWAHQKTVARLCGKRYAPLLDSMERLRYAEEHGVRHQAAELTGLRRQVRHEVSLLSAPPPSP